MSFWRRIFGDDGGSPEPVDDAPEPAPEPAPQGPEDRLRALGDPRAAAGQPPADDEVLELVSTLVSSGREARAIDLARRVMARHPGMTAVRLRVAELLAGRGDDAGADALLAPVTDEPAPPPRAVMLRGEIAERRGDEVEALAWYERVLARDLDYPGARERVERLRERREPERNLAGATLMTDGALTRGRYRVVRELGRGGAGTVFAAMDTSLGRRIALKVYHRRGRLERERLRAEARSPAMLEHPGVIRVFDLDEGLGAIAMEWVRGGSVRQQLRKGAVPIERVRRWAASALEALHYVHRHQVVHRDLKPSNLLLREDDSIVLTDFGLATPTGSTPQARGGGGEGTLAYMAPEQRAGRPALPSADVHAFGASLREMLSQASGERDPGLLELAEACMRREPTARPQVQELLEALRPLTAGTRSVL